MGTQTKAPAVAGRGFVEALSTNDASSVPPLVLNFNRASVRGQVTALSSVEDARAKELLGRQRLLLSDVGNRHALQLNRYGAIPYPAPDHRINS